MYSCFSRNEASVWTYISAASFNSPDSLSTSRSNLILPSQIYKNQLSDAFSSEIPFPHLWYLFSELLGSVKTQTISFDSPTQWLAAAVISCWSSFSLNLLNLQCLSNQCSKCSFYWNSWCGVCVIDWILNNKLQS